MNSIRNCGRLLSFVSVACAVLMAGANARADFLSVVEKRKKENAQTTTPEPKKSISEKKPESAPKLAKKANPMPVRKTEPAPSSLEIGDRKIAMEDIGPTVIAETIREPEKGAFHWEAAYIAETARNFQGGARVGSSYLGLAVLRGHVDLDQAVGWKGGSFFLHLQSTHGRDPSLHVGDLQVSSNIEAEADTGKVYEAWVQQAFLEDKASVLFGLYDLNSEFYVTEPAGVFLNASFGIGQEMAQTGENGPSIFPTTSLAARGKVHANENVYLQAVVLEAVSGDPSNPHGTQLNYRPSEGKLLVTEMGYEPGAENDEGRKGKYALGGWTYTNQFDHQSEVDAAGAPAKGTSHGIYVLANQDLTDELAAFVRFGTASSGVNRVSSNVSGGVVLSGGVYGREHDEIGLGFTAVTNGDEYKAAMTAAGTPSESTETALELTYKLGLTKDIWLQPDMQYVLNPNTDPTQKDALVGLLRLRIGFED